MISAGDKLPESTLVQFGANGPEPVELGPKLKGRKVVIFGLPAAFSGTCSEAQMPSFIRTKDQFAAKGVDEIICITGNDPFVLNAWSEATGADKAGITLLGDPECNYIEAIGMRLDFPPAGLIGRSQRYAMYAEDGVVKLLQKEENPGVCDVSAGESLLDAM
jgi:cytochrome c peroxidase